MVMQYLIALQTVLMVAVPALVCALALRRLILSRSFNRVLYAAMTLLSAETVIGRLGAPAGLVVPEAGTWVFPCLCLGLWLTVTTLGPSTRGLSRYDLRP